MVKVFTKTRCGYLRTRHVVLGASRTKTYTHVHILLVQLETCVHLLIVTRQRNQRASRMDAYLGSARLLYTAPRRGSEFERYLLRVRLWTQRHLKCKPYCNCKPQQNADYLSYPICPHPHRHTQH